MYRHISISWALLLALLSFAVPSSSTAQSLLTRAERTDYQETSSYDDVMSFLSALEDSPDLHVRTFGYSYEGRALPLVVVGRGLADGSAAEVLSRGGLRVFVFANIHAGEVEGKEAAQMLLRSLAAGDRDHWLDSMVLLVAPLYNADGNEAVSVTNRFRQQGPTGGVGTRANAQGLDLNRDHMKLASPESRAVAGVLSDYDPQVVVDLHTTNGTHHAYHLTYSPPLHPNTHGSITSLLREGLFPEVTERIHRDRGWHFYYYGNAYAPPGMERGWYTFDHRPRFGTNYVGLRNRFAILSEAYSYVDFRGRVEATLAFVEAILDYSHANAGPMAEAVRQADAEDLVGQRLGVRATFQRDGISEILMGAVEERLDPVSGHRYMARLDVVRPERMPEYGSFRVTEWERVPEEYYVPEELAEVIDLLRFHGVPVRELGQDREVAVQRFAIDSTRVAEREFQGRRERELFGAWEDARVTLWSGTVAVPVRGEPLARLIFYLLEPRSDDGVVNWNVLDAQLRDGASHYPVLRRMPGG